MVESDFGTIDASLDRQFDEMARALLGDAARAARRRRDGTQRRRLRRDRSHD